MLSATSAHRGPRAHKHAADPRVLFAASNVCHWPAQVGLEPAGEIHRPVRRRHADIAQVAGDK